MAEEARRAPNDIRPSLTDEEVLEFCKTGILRLEGVIPESTNRWVFDYLDRENADPHDLVRDEYFIDEVLLHPAVAGVIRSLLGAQFQLPDWMANHRLVGPVEASYWHIDAGSNFERACNLLQVFYIPQANTPEMGPTLFLPGSHLVPIAREDVERFGSLAGQQMTAAPAGSVFVTAYSIWHRQPPKADRSTRNLLKWVYWRTEQPERDWVADPNFDFGGADYTHSSDYFHGPARMWQSVPRVAEMFYWLCGKTDEFHMVGGAGWPYSSTDPGFRADLP
ncbi:MAG: phytanoyl-CoA dioxygenase family protein [Caldilineaceae bacterium]|nr:phytanoyl-CoA dioxygenase family protein [Caldilineaceae bacterium]